MNQDEQSSLVGWTVADALGIFAFSSTNVPADNIVIDLTLSTDGNGNIVDNYDFFVLSPIWGPGGFDALISSGQNPGPFQVNDGASAYGEWYAINTTDGSWSVTPEPSSILMLGSGLLGLAGMLRRKLKA